MTDPVHIAFFLPSFAGGGAERALLQVANAFAQRGLRVDLLVGDATGPYASEVSDAVTVLKLGKKRVMACMGGIARYLQRARPAAIVSTMMHANIVVTVARLVSRQPVRVVLRESNVADVWNRKPIAEGKSLLLRIASVIYPFADSIVCVSSGVRDSIVSALRLDASQVSVIMNPVVSDKLFSLASELVPEQIELPRRPYVVAVGRLTHVKAFDILIQAFAEYRKVHDHDLLVLGEGPQRSELEALARQCAVEHSVHMPGFVINPFPLIKQAELFVMSSRYEGLPNALIQAVALECPAVVTDMPHGPKEILAEDKYGITVPVDDIRGLCEGMIAATGNRDWPRPDEQWYARFSETSVIDQYLLACGLEPQPHEETRNSQTLVDGVCGQ